MKKHPDKQCSVCGFIPDDTDIELTNYKVNTCETCGQENVCDLCLFHILNKNDINSFHLSRTQCPNCQHRTLGKNRKEILDFLY